jgi:hypothetical protein
MIRDELFERVVELLERLDAELVVIREERNRARLPGRLLSRRDLAELGLPRRAIDAVFRVVPVIVLPGYARPFVREEDYLELLRTRSYGDDRVRPTS